MKIKRFFVLIFSILLFAQFCMSCASSQTISDEQIMTYSELIEYRPSKEEVVYIEAVVGLYDIVTENEFHYALWVKDDERFYPVEMVIHPKSLSLKIDLPKPGQKVIYGIEVDKYPFNFHGSITESDILSAMVLEESVDYTNCYSQYVNSEVVSYETLSRYKEIYALSMTEYESGSTAIPIEVIVGQMYIEDDRNYSFDLWIKGDEGYYRVRENVISEVYLQTQFRDMPQSGQRKIYYVKPYYDGHFYGENVVTSYLLEENNDFEAVEKNGIETNPEIALIKQDFNESDFEELSYRNVLRDIENNVYKPVVVEGTYRVSDRNLMIDNDRNYITLSIYPDISAIKLLKGDRIRVYGYVSDQEYKYNKEPILGIIVRKIELVE